MKKHKERGKTELEKRLEKEAAEMAAAQPEQQPEAEAEQPQQAEQQDLDAIIAERDEAKDQLLRTLADYDNYRKRIARESERARALAAEALVRDLLPALDNLERAVEHAGADAGPLAEGVTMVLDQFRAALERHGLKQIPAINEPFDPNVHEAMMQTESDELPPDHVVQEFQKGYMLGDYIVRPAKVVVSKAASQPAAAADKPDEAQKPHNE